MTRLASFVAAAALFFAVSSTCLAAGAQGLGSTKNINVLRPDGVPGKSAISGVVADPDGDDEISNAERAEERRQRREARQQRREQERAERQRRREARQQREEERVEQRRQRREARRQRQRQQQQEESEDDGSQQGSGKRRGADQLQLPARVDDCLPPKTCLDDRAVRPRFNP